MNNLSEGVMLNGHYLWAVTEFSTVGAASDRDQLWIDKITNILFQNFYRLVRKYKAALLGTCTSFFFQLIHELYSWKITTEKETCLEKTITAQLCCTCFFYTRFFFWNFCAFDMPGSRRVGLEIEISAVSSSWWSNAMTVHINKTSIFHFVKMHNYNTWAYKAR